MAVVVLTYQKMPSHTLLLQKKLKIHKEQKPFTIVGQPGVGDSHPVAVGVLVDLTDLYRRVSVACEKV
jgi:hypothetical protein